MILKREIRKYRTQKTDKSNISNFLVYKKKVVRYL
jgi:hypothetical protein